MELGVEQKTKRKIKLNSNVQKLKKKSKLNNSIIQNSELYTQHSEIRTQHSISLRFEQFSPYFLVGRPVELLQELDCFCRSKQEEG